MKISHQKSTQFSLWPSGFTYHVFHGTSGILEPSSMECRECTLQMLPCAKAFSSAQVCAPPLIFGFRGAHKIFHYISSLLCSPGAQPQPLVVLCCARKSYIHSGLENFQKMKPRILEMRTKFTSLTNLMTWHSMNLAVSAP